MKEYILARKANCKNCYKCIRHCPVKSIRFSGGEASIVADECILCGRCYVVCPQEAKYVISDVEAVKEWIAKGEHVIASLAPSFVANFDEASIESMREAMKKLGFADVQETALGATLVKKKYEEMMKENRNQVLISSCCPSINTLIQKRFPEALPYLAAVDTPAVAHAKMIKKSDKKAKVVFIGPCIAKKAEADFFSQWIDKSLTFQELDEWLRESNVDINKELDSEKIGRARNFPTTGGILRSMDLEEDVDYVSIDGVKNCMRSLNDIIGGKVTGCFIEMSACIGSCVGGPAMSKPERKPVNDVQKIRHNAGKQDFKIGEKQIPESLHCEHSYVGVHHTLPGQAAIDEILRKMGKKTKADELNCGSCGYNTCREKAIAVYLGKADLSMCLPFLKERAESFSDNIIGNTPNGVVVLNDSLEVQQINKAACKMMNIPSQADILGYPVVRVLDPVDFITVASTKKNVHDKRVYLAEYGKYVEETILYDNNYDIIILLMRDVTEEEKSQREKEKISQHTVEITDKVIDKQMRVVQEIASLLGETTAETKIALTTLKETLKNE